ncbi:UvrD-helicase domain-containing protein [Caenimonas koreensis]|uniref:UvrD-helicase domain-containing protein n=1 Tax=Caenimonas koreensis TaxID=367474 RepID=UPI003782DD98
MSGPGYEHNDRVVDAATFYAIACDPRRSVVVEACAGAGKTWMLVSRILRALLAGAQPQEILAITFTKKAAGEMRQRLQEWLSTFAKAPPEVLKRELQYRGIAHPSDEEVSALRGLYARLLGAGRPVRILTFHAWFASLLRNAPLAVMEHLNLPANYQLLEDDAEAVELVWRRFHAALVAQPEARRDFEASVAAHGRSNTRKALQSALAKRVEFAFADDFGSVEKSVKPFDEQFPEFSGLAVPGEAVATPGASRQLLADAARALGRAKAPTHSAKGVELEQAIAKGDLDAVMASLLTQKGDARKFSDKLEGLEHIRAAQELVLRLQEASHQHDAWLHQQRMARLTRVLVAQFSMLKREHGWIDMNDVEQAAQELLASSVLSGWVQEKLDARIRHLLIDEFQDTNPLQWQALHSWLASYGGAGEAPGMFIVGDPKQSIYRFRRAEPQVFLAAQQFIQDIGGEKLSCDHTRRNSQAVMSLVNTVMGQAQDEGQYERFRPHTTESVEQGDVCFLPQIHRDALDADAAAVEIDEHTGLPAWRDSLTVPRDLPEEKLIELECRQAANWIAQEIARGVKPRDIMVLARRRTRLAAMEEALRALRIPAQQPEKTDLREAPEVQDIVALFDALVSTSHDLSLARALKSPVFGVSDDALVALAVATRALREEGRAASWYELLQREKELHPGLRAAGEQLAQWKALVELLPPHDALEEIYRRGDVIAKFVAASPASMRDAVVSHLQALPGAALEIDGGRYATPYAFVRALKAGNIEAPPLAEAQAVRLLTVHGAKGLEASIVLMLDTDGAPPKAETMGVVVEWPGDAPAPWRFAFLASETKPPACSAEALEVERMARQREELNALYVAMTRAKSRLVISSVEPHRAAEASWWQRLQPHCNPLPAAPSADISAANAGAAQQVAVHALPALTAAAPPPRKREDPDSESSRFGQVLHRLLELSNGSPQFSDTQVRRVAREFALEEPKARVAADKARVILSGEGAWAWDETIINWQANEVPMTLEGKAIRLDRLVRRADSGEWWVLDFKSHSRPEDDNTLIEQMRSYRTAVQTAHPDAPVRAAFLTGQGRLVRVD